MKYHVYTVEHPVIPDGDLLRAVHLEDGETETQEQVLALRDELCAVARPKYLLGECAVTGVGEDWAELDGQRFPSPLLGKNLKDVKTVHPFFATCGREAEDKSRSITDVFEAFWCEEIKLLLLREASEPLEKLARETYFPEGHMSAMDPGSLPSWPLTAQRDLFRLVGAGTEELGLRLTEACLMVPHKSISGIYFHSEDDFVNCAFCKLLDCPNRRQAYSLN